VDCGGDCPYTCEIIASCTNGIQDGNEEDIDCGGDCPFTCEIIESCSNGIQDGNEGGIDCGGDCPVSCELLASCNNGIQDGNEEDIDCGGNCPFSCEIIESCSNGIQDGNEEDVDCGGDCPYTCEIIASCSNGIQDGNEEDVDCGGSCPDVCDLSDFSLFITDACNCVNGVDIDSDGNLDLAEETITFVNGVPPYTVISSTNNFYDSDGMLLSNMDMTDLFNNADNSIVVYVPADSVSLHVVTVADSTDDTASAFGGPCPSCTFTMGGGVPTLSQWGLIILSLLLLTFGGMAIILEQETDLIKSNGFKNTPIPIFWAALFKKLTLKGIPFMLLAFGIFTIADGGFFVRNVVGTLISAGIIVYFIHFVKMYDIITKNNNSVFTIKNLPDSIYFLTWNNEKKLRLKKE